MMKTLQLLLASALLVFPLRAEAQAPTKDPTGLQRAEPVEVRQRVEVDGLIATVESITECCPNRIVVRVEGKDQADLATIDFEARFQEVLGLVPVASGKALLVGKLRYGGDILGVLDLASGQYLDEMWAYGYGLSPDGRFLIYCTHYPRQILPGGDRSVVLLYDLGRTPEENRRGDRSRQLHDNPGRPLYPEVNREEESVNPFLYPLRIYLTSPIAWSKDGSVGVFIVGDQDYEYTLVRVTLPRPPAQEVAVNSWPLDLTPYIVPGAEKIPFGTGEGEVPLAFPVLSLEWRKPGSLSVKTYPHDYLLDRFELPLPWMERAQP